ncbi:MAG: polyribonucleotide nucleotidyltransferase [Actinobacteria bacterium]|nr:polyribonucleotide nucleotidyltransferase [Actinomycetota bacterium]
MSTQREPVYIVDAVRSPVGRAGGGLAEVHPADLGAEVIAALIDRTGIDPGEVDDVMVGNVDSVDDVMVGNVDSVGPQAGCLARTAWLVADMPEHVPGTTIDRRCGSSQQAVHFAAQAILSGQADMVVAGGIQSMSQVPMMQAFAVPGDDGFDPFTSSPGWVKRYGDSRFDQFDAAERIAERFDITRGDMEAFALESHRRAIAAAAEGRFNNEIVEVAGLRHDECPRVPDAARVAALRPLRQGGRLTAAVSCQLADAAAKPVADYPVFLEYEDDAYDAVERLAIADVRDALAIVEKAPREARLDDIKTTVVAELAANFEGREKELSAAFRAVTKTAVRDRVLRDKVRIDGRGLTDIRSLSAEVDILPRTHGSALFERGETQILGVTTLNMLRMEQLLDTLNPDNRKRYMHNYNFPPYSTGETGRVGSPKRREIGHGALAERALLPVLPTREEFPYAIRQVSEALGSNGSTSMGSVCASTMALLNAGVPLKAPVAGIAMGLISGDVDGSTEYVTLTDILGAEDAYGDMDFKVAGTREFVTALQLDTKLDGIPADILAGALTQARDARMTILDVMNEAIDAPDEMADTAPRVISVKVPVDKIGEVIGPKGKIINQIQEDTGADITIEDDGTIYIGATDGPSAEAARTAINNIANPTMPEVGERYLGTVVKTTNFGAFVSLVPGKDGLLHISEVKKLTDKKRIETVEEVLNVGDKVQVEIKEIDQRIRVTSPCRCMISPSSSLIFNK